MAVASLALVTFCIAIFTSVYIHAGAKVPVLALARNVPQGRVITRSDLAVVRVSFSSGLAPISADQLAHVIGKAAAVSLLRGTLLTSPELATNRGPARGQAVVGIAVKAGQLPAEGVAVGDSVDVILTGSPAGLTGGASDGSEATNSATGAQEIGAVLAPNATVTGIALATEANADSSVISVLIPSTLAPLVASASASGQCALVLVGSSP